MKKTTHHAPNTTHSTLSVVLATKDEEANIARCLNSVKSIADEIIVFDEYSKDRTVEIAKRYNAKVFYYQHKANFHETKQKAIDKAKGDWILQLDADEEVTPGLAREICQVLNLTDTELLVREPLNIKQARLFQRHQELVEQREGVLGKKDKEVAAFFIPRKNIFLGKPLIHGGVYPDGVIRLFKRGKARLPAKNVHELMEVDGQVIWLFNDLDHYDSPTLKRYLDRNKRYVKLIAGELKEKRTPISPKTLFLYLIYLPIATFFTLYLRHKAFLDGYRGFIWSFFSALRFPRAYLAYLLNKTAV